MGGALLAIDRARIGVAVAHHLCGDRPWGIGEQGLDGGDSLARVWINSLSAGKSSKRHSGLR